MHYSDATVWISVGAGGDIWLSMFSETHMANHSSLKTLDRNSVCVVKGMARVLDDCIQVEKNCQFWCFHLGECCLICHQVVIISVWHMYCVNTRTCICICITKYLYSTFSIVQYGSVAVTSMKNHNVFMYKHTYIYVHERKKPFRLPDFLGCWFLPPSAACKLK